MKIKSVFLEQQLSRADVANFQVEAATELERVKGKLSTAQANIREAEFTTAEAFIGASIEMLKRMRKDMDQRKLVNR